jgi:hypothetical protein
MFKKHFYQVLNTLCLCRLKKLFIFYKMPTILGTGAVGGGGLKYSTMGIQGDFLSF